MPGLPRFRTIAIPFLLAALAPGSEVFGATTRSWPGAAPCDTSLQACADGSASGDTVQVQTNGPIAEDVTIFGKALNLVAKPGYRPVFAAGDGIVLLYSPGAGVSWSTLIDGFTLLDGRVRIGGGGNMTVTVRNLDISTTTTTDTGAAIAIAKSGTGTLDFDVSRNRVRIHGVTTLHGVSLYSDAGSTLGGSVHDNRIESTSLADGGDSGVLLISTTATAPSVRVYSNQITGHLYTGFTFWVAGASNLLLANNLFRTTISGSYGVQLAQSADVGNSMNAQVFNNTFGGWDIGILGNGSPITGRMSGNLFAYNASLAIKQQSSTLSEDHSLFFANGGPAPVLGSGSMIADPKFKRGADDMRLGAGSPAIDAADSAALTTVLANASLPQIDADGSRRFKGAGSLADIGAFESGDGSLIEFVSAANAGVIDNALLNANSGALPQLTQDKAPDTYTATAYDAGFTALAYSSNHFAVVDEDGSAPAPGSAFNVFAPAAGNGALLHTTSAGNVSASPALTQINDTYLNGRSEAIVLATQRPTPYFNHPFGVTYGFFLSNTWFIYQADAGANSFPMGLQFDIYAQDPSLNAFVWNAPFAGPSTSIDHVLLNGEPCARVQVTNGVSDAHPIAVTYAAQRWTIVNVDGGNIPVGAEFYVVVDEAATQFCRYDHIFHNGVEAN